MCVCSNLGSHCYSVGVQGIHGARKLLKNPEEKTSPFSSLLGTLHVTGAM